MPLLERRTSSPCSPSLAKAQHLQTQESGYCGRVFTFFHSRNSQNTQFFKRFVGQFLSVSFYADFEKSREKVTVFVCQITDS